MKNIFYIISFLLIPILGYSAGVIEVTFTNQADFDAYNFVPTQPYWINLENDTTLSVSNQINNLQPVSNVDTLILDLEFTQIANINVLTSTRSLALFLEGDKNFDTLFIPDNVLFFSLNCKRSYVEHIYGAAKVKRIGFMTLYDNDYLKTVDLDLGEMDIAGPLGLELSVQQNDSLKTFYWNNPHRQLSAFSFFENRQLKHVHIETAKEKVAVTSNATGGFVFNPELDSISGFKGLENSWITQIRMNYMLDEVCVLQKGTQKAIDLDPSVESAYKIENNGTGLQSLNDLLTADCSWLPNGVKELNYQELSLYPNPAHNEVFVEIPNQSTQYQIYDMSGKIVQQGNVEANGRIGLATVSGGMYILLVGEKRSKLVVQ